ncbi:hypothetical protein GJ496_004339 [Pomphorhynchus laevis]|nr:hypothetical protein GJ496_004339 [Pomphorhynchus laevis]
MDVPGSIKPSFTGGYTFASTRFLSDDMDNVAHLDTINLRNPPERLSGLDIQTNNNLDETIEKNVETFDSAVQQLSIRDQLAESLITAKSHGDITTSYVIELSEFQALVNRIERLERSTRRTEILQLLIILGLTSLTLMRILKNI